MGELETDARFFADEQKKRALRAGNAGREEESKFRLHSISRWPDGLRVFCAALSACASAEAARGSGSDELATDRNEMPGWRRAEHWINRMGRKS